MILSPYTLSTRLLVPFALLVLSPLVCQPRSKTITADEQSVPVSQKSNLVVSHPKTPTKSIQTIIVKGKDKKQSKVGDILSKLDQLGPLISAAAYSMSDFSVQGFVKGKWPIVIVYELEADSTAEITISTNEGKDKYQVLLPPTDGDEVKRYLPETFGQKPQLGLISFKALKNGPEPRKPARFFLYGLGVGDKAVGSLVIVQLRFQPPSIRPKLKEKASYSFRSLSDFNNVAAEVSLAVAADNTSHLQLVYSKEFKDGVRRGQVVTDDWDGKNSKGQISVGTHQFHVRAWSGLKDGGAWTVVSERRLVKVQKE
ncbi:MAG TPA: hypothetical protein VGO73_12560 [Pyrinomonadaceae bacterium]|jgi:hypothetical protein|nr:hypothetical protein [Pyrinomonadaceae bacterium]